jgi:hypothetical protein
VSEMSADTIMSRANRKMQLSPRSNERKFPFVVQIAVPDGGFGCTLDAINAWHFYSKHGQRLGRRQEMGEQQFWRWCFAQREIAEHFRRRFGGEMVPLVVRQCATQGPCSPIDGENAATDKTASKKTDIGKPNMENDMENMSSCS